MRDDQARPSLHDHVECGLDRGFVVGVERTGRFVEDQDARVLEEHSSDRETLALAAGELVAAFADDGLVAVRQRRDEVVNVGRGRDLGELFVGCVRLGVSQIRRDGVVEEVRLLRDDPDVASQRFQR